VHGRARKGRIGGSKRGKERNRGGEKRYTTNALYKTILQLTGVIRGFCFSPAHASETMMVSSKCRLVRLGLLTPAWAATFPTRVCVGDMGVVAEDEGGRVGQNWGWKNECVYSGSSSIHSIGS
jgi:hypothetical protein